MVKIGKNLVHVVIECTLGHSIGAVKITFSKCVAAENRPGQKRDKQRQRDARPPETKIVEKWKNFKKILNL